MITVNDRDLVRNTLLRIVDYAIKASPPMYISASEVIELVLGCFYKWRLKYIYGSIDPSDPVVEKYMSKGAKIHSFVINKILELHENGLLEHILCDSKNIPQDKPVEEPKSIDDHIVNLIAQDLLENTIDAIRKFIHRIARGSKNCKDYIKKLRILAEIDLMSPNFALIGTPDLIIEDAEKKYAAIIELKSYVYSLVGSITSKVEKPNITDKELYDLYKSTVKDLKKNISYQYENKYFNQIFLYAILESERLSLSKRYIKDRIGDIIKDYLGKEASDYLKDIINPLYTSVLIRIFENLSKKHSSRIYRHYRELAENLLEKMSMVDKGAGIIVKYKVGDNILERIVKEYIDMFNRINRSFDEYVQELIMGIVDRRVLMFLVTPYGVKLAWSSILGKRDEAIKKLYARAKAFISAINLALLYKVPIDVILSEYKDLGKILSILEDEQLYEHGFENIIARETELVKTTRDLMNTIFSTEVRTEANNILRKLRSLYHKQIEKYAKEGGIGGYYNISKASPDRTLSQKTKCKYCPELLRSMCRLYTEYSRIVLEHRRKHRKHTYNIDYSVSLPFSEKLAECVQRNLDVQRRLLYVWSLVWVARFNLFRDSVEKYRPYNLVDRELSKIKAEELHTDDNKMKIDVFDYIEPVVYNGALMLKASRRYYSFYTSSRIRESGWLDIGKPEVKPIGRGGTVLVIFNNDSAPSPLLKINTSAVMDNVRYNIENDRIEAILRPLPYYSRAPTQFRTIKILLSREPNLRQNIVLVSITTSITRLFLPAVMAYELDLLINILKKCLSNETTKHS